MRDRVMRTIAASAMVASLLLPERAGAGAGAATPSDQDVTVGVLINASHDGRVAGATERPPLTRAWSRELGPRLSHPVIVEGKVFVVAGSDTQLRLYALDAATGGDVWAPVLLVGGGRTAYGAGRIFVAGYDQIRAFDAATGRLEWDVKVEGGIASAPTYANGRVFVDSGGAVQAVSATDGRRLWATPTGGGWGESSPAVSETGVYVSYYSGEAWAFDPATGAVRWHREPTHLAGGGRAPALAGGRLWIRDPLRQPQGPPDLALDVVTGAVAGTYRSDAAPAFDGDTGYFVVGRALEARNILSGALLWSFAADGDFTAAPIVVNGFVYAASVTGQLWALDVSTGLPVWGDRIGIPVPNVLGGTARALGAGQGLVVVSARPFLIAYASAAPGVRSPWITSVHGGLASPALGNDTSPSVVVSAVTSGETVALREGGAVRATKTVPAGASTVTFNAGPADVDFTLTGDGDHALSAVVVGGGALVLPSASFTYTLDTVPPQPPVVWVDVEHTQAVGDVRSPFTKVFGVASGHTVSLLVDGIVRATSVTGPSVSEVLFNIPQTPPAFVLTTYGTHLVTATATEPAGNVSSPSPSVPYDLVNEPGRFHALEPSRILDTRMGTGGVTGPVGPNGTLTVPMAGRGGVPATGASAVVVNVTVTQPSTGGILTVFPAGTARPLTSSLNFVAGETVPNLVVAKLGTDGKIGVYNSNGTTHVVLDVVGWYQEEGIWTGGLYNPLTPSRILDTRNGTGGLGAPVGPGATVTIQVAGRGGVPPLWGLAAALNVTVTEPSTGGYLTVYPSTMSRPLASNLNFVAGQTLPNLVVSKLGGDGRVSIYNSSGTSQLIVDVVGWYGADKASTGSRYTAVNPSRLLDTRTGAGPVGPGTITVPVAGQGGVPASASAVVVNVTVTQPSVGGYLTVFPGGTARPLASNLNFVAGQTVPNLVVAKLGTDGRMSLYNSAGTTQVILDVVGWYGP